MRSLSPEVKVNYLSICALVAYLVLPVLNRGLPSSVRVAFVCVALTAYYISLCLIDREGGLETSIVIVISALFVVLCYFGSRQTVGLSNYVFANYLFWIPFLFIYNRRLLGDNAFRRLLSRFILALVVITAVTTLVGLIQDPMVSRFLATGRTEEYGLREYSIRNVGDYNFIYSLVIMLPLLVGAWRASDAKRSVIILALILSLACLIKAQYSIALIIAVIVLSMALLMKRLSPLKLCVVIVAEVVLLKALYYSLPSIIDLVSNLGPSASFIRYRLSDTLATINSDSVFGLDRVQRLLMSWDVFVENPLTGNLFASSMAELGNHSTLFDLLGRMGLIAIVFISFFFVAMIRRYVAWAISPSLKPCVTVAVVAFIVIGIVNTVLSSFTMLVILLLLPLGLDVDDTEQLRSRV